MQSQRAPLHIEKTAYGVVQLRGLIAMVGIVTNLKAMLSKEQRRQSY